MNLILFYNIHLNYKLHGSHTGSVFKFSAIHVTYTNRAFEYINDVYMYIVYYKIKQMNYFA